jgi:hypothetical protein
VKGHTDSSGSRVREGGCIWEDLTQNHYFAYKTVKNTMLLYFYIRRDTKTTCVHVFLRIGIQRIVKQHVCIRFDNRLAVSLSVFESHVHQVPCLCTGEHQKSWGRTTAMDRVLFHICVGTRHAKGMFRETLKIP